MSGYIYIISNRHRRYELRGCDTEPIRGINYNKNYKLKFVIHTVHWESRKNAIKRRFCLEFEFQNNKFKGKLDKMVLIILEECMTTLLGFERAVESDSENTSDCISEEHEIISDIKSFSNEW